MSIIVSPQEHFVGLVKEALSQRKIATYPQVESYLVNLLQHFLEARNLFDAEYDEHGNKQPTTLAELFLVANNSDPITRVELLKKLADKSLYISGYFGDSLQRKLVDVDYYVNMGGTAYAVLANSVKEDTHAKVFSIFSKRFVDFVDVLTIISQKSMLKDNQNILRLYDRYLKTGSTLAKETLVELGVITLPKNLVKTSKQ